MVTFIYFSEHSLFSLVYYEMTYPTRGTKISLPPIRRTNRNKISLVNPSQFRYNVA